jgi:hypothetical protein
MACNLSPADHDLATALLGLAGHGLDVSVGYRRAIRAVQGV